MNRIPGVEAVNGRDESRPYINSLLQGQPESPSPTLDRLWLLFQSAYGPGAAQPRAGARGRVQWYSVRESVASHPHRSESDIRKLGSRPDATAPPRFPRH